MLDPQTLTILKTIIQKHLDLTQYQTIIFGSHVRGNNRKWSDIDLGIIGSAPLDPSTYFDLNDDFIQSDLPYKVDLVDFAQVTPTFRKNALKNALYLN